MFFASPSTLNKTVTRRYTLNLLRLVFFSISFAFRRISAMSIKPSAANTVNVVTSPFLTPKEDNVLGPKSSALIILNSPIPSPPSPVLQELWKQSEIVVCADGGANRLYDATVVHHGENSSTWVPHLIKGDLDSLRTDVRAYYVQHDCVVVKDPDQNKNDLDKSISAIKSRGFKNCFIFGAFGGRFDQEMAAFQALYRWQDYFDSMWLYDDQTCAVLMPANVENQIEITHHDHSTRDPSVPGEGPTCGLIPLSGAVESVTTTGLKWDLQDHPTSFGGLLSTSNHVVGPVVTVKASGPLIFTAEVTSGVRRHPGR